MSEENKTIVKKEKKKKEKTNEVENKETSIEEELFVYVNETIKGEKKDVTKDIQTYKGYQPSYVEAGNF
jgi:hypothetical protein